MLRPRALETTALGAAYLAGLTVNLWKTREEIEVRWKPERRFEPQMDEDRREKLFRGWKKAVQRTLDWEEH